MEDFFKYVECAVTVCDTECVIVYLSEGVTNSYTISKKGQRKLIHQTPWYKETGDTARDAQDGPSGRTIAGIIELSIVIPEEMPHYDRG